MQVSHQNDDSFVVVNKICLLMDLFEEQEVIASFDSYHQTRCLHLT